VSLTGSSKHKVIIIDEADNTGNDVQMLLRANIEAFYNNCRFIFTCNYKNKIIEPLHSRCACIDFTIKGKQKAQLAGAFFKRLQTILDTEKVEYDQKSFLQNLYPNTFQISVGSSTNVNVILQVEKLMLVFLPRSLTYL
jgi:DNA polymerase III delta prime subunit